MTSYQNLVPQHDLVYEEKNVLRTFIFVKRTLVEIQKALKSELSSKETP